MKLIWYQVLNNELRILSEAHTILYTEPSRNSKANRDKITQMFFEEFNVSGRKKIHILFLNAHSALLSSFDRFVRVHSNQCFYSILMVDQMAWYIIMEIVCHMLYLSYTQVPI
jgi:hypothetical protein